MRKTGLALLFGGELSAFSLFGDGLSVLSLFRGGFPALSLFGGTALSAGFSDCPSASDLSSCGARLSLSR